MRLEVLGASSNKLILHCHIVKPVTNPTALKQNPGCRWKYQPRRKRRI